VVPSLYISELSDANPIAFDYNHIDIVKPANPQADVYMWAKARITEASQIQVTADDATRDRKAAYGVRIIGQDTVTVGSLVNFDLGYIPADTVNTYKLNIRPEARNITLRIASSDPPVDASWEIGNRTVPVSEAGGGTLVVTINSPITSTKRVSIVTLESADSTQSAPLTLRVSFEGLQETVSSRNDSGPKPSGNGQDSSQNYQLCADPPAVGDYRIDSVGYSLTGDRQCNSWSSCQRMGGNACFVFNMQGHSECTRAFSGCAATRDSEGHIQATFKLQRSTPSLAALVGD
jgi:hypothetical protein